MNQWRKAVAAATALQGRLRRHEGHPHRTRTHKRRSVAAPPRCATQCVRGRRGHGTAEPVRANYCPARQTVSSGLVQLGLQRRRRNLEGPRLLRRSVLRALQPPSGAFIGLHFLLLQALDLFLSLLKSRSLSSCHAGSFHPWTGIRIRAETRRRLAQRATLRPTGKLDHGLCSGEATKPHFTGLPWM